MNSKLKSILGDDIFIQKKAFIIKFNGKRKVVSTSILNGGTQTNIDAVFNYDGKEDSTNKYLWEENTYIEHLKNIAIKLGLNPNTATGLSTSADIKNLGMSIKRKNETLVSAYVTAGVKGNAGRAGDPSSFDEMNLKDTAGYNGTINIIVEINAHLPHGALANALITVTETKSAILQELQIGSRYSTQIATGTGTDGCIIISNQDSKYNLNYTGKHALLGELIANAVKDALRQALFKQENISVHNRFDFFILTRRYGINKEQILDQLVNTSNKQFDYDKILKLVEIISSDRNTVIPTIIITYLNDLTNWGIITEQDALIIVRILIFISLNNLDINKIRDIPLFKQNKLSHQIKQVLEKIFIDKIRQLLV